MPIRAVYEHFDAPKDLSIPVQKDEPEGREWLTHPKEWNPSCFREKLDRRANIRLCVWYFCRYCEGWINREPFRHSVNTLDGRRRAGRRGTETYCVRCGQQIHFEGMMS